MAAINKTIVDVDTNATNSCDTQMYQNDDLLCKDEIIHDLNNGYYSVGSHVTTRIVNDKEIELWHTPRIARNTIAKKPYFFRRCNKTSFHYDTHAWRNKQPRSFKFYGHPKPNGKN